MPTQAETEDDVSISSVVYNLAGPEDGRTDFLKSLIAAAVAQDAPIADTLRTGYLKGPGIRYRQFGRFASNNSEFTQNFGVTSGNLASIASIDLELARSQVPMLSSDKTVDSVERAEIQPGRIHFWVLQYMAQNYPTSPVVFPKMPFAGLTPGTYELTQSNAGYLVTIKLWTGTTVSFVPAGYDPAAKYCYIKYTPAWTNNAGPRSFAMVQTLAPTDPDPVFGDPWFSMGDHTASTYSTTLPSQDTVDITYSDGRPAEHHSYPEVMVPYSIPLTSVHYAKDEYGGKDAFGADYTLRTHKEFWRTYSVATDTTSTSISETLTDGAIRTTVRHRTWQYLKPVRNVLANTQQIRWKTRVSPQWYIYKYQTGKPALDAVMAPPAVTGVGAFYPPIPFRYDNMTIGPRKKVATRWKVHLGNLGFDDWDEDSYDSWTTDYDVQVAKSLTATDDDYISVKPILDPTPGTPGDWFVESRDSNHPLYQVFSEDRKSTRLNSSHVSESRMPSSA